MKQFSRFSRDYVLNCALALLLVFIASGCSWMPWNWRKKNQPAPAVANDAQTRPANTNDNRLLIAATTVGKVLSVNTQGRFIALQFPSGQLPAVGTTMVVYRGDAKIGEVKVSGPTLGSDLIAADIVLGLIQEGDEVRAQ